MFCLFRLFPIYSLIVGNGYSFDQQSQVTGNIDLHKFIQRLDVNIQRFDTHPGTQVGQSQCHQVLVLNQCRSIDDLRIREVNLDHNSRT